jgi:hypothetical protein
MGRPRRRRKRRIRRSRHDLSSRSSSREAQRRRRRERSLGKDSKLLKRKLRTKSRRIRNQVRRGELRLYW